jgi:hypothetical protein
MAVGKDLLRIVDRKEWRCARRQDEGTRGATSLPRADGANNGGTRQLFCVPWCSTRGRSRRRLLERKILKKVERSATGLLTAFFRMGAELNDLPEVTGVAEWRFREQLKPRLLKPKPMGPTNDTGLEVQKVIGGHQYEQPNQSAPGDV